VVTAARLIIDEAHQFLTFISSYCQILNLLIHRAGKTLAAIKRLLMSSSGSVWVHKQSKSAVEQMPLSRGLFFCGSSDYCVPFPYADRWGRSECSKCTAVQGAPMGPVSSPESPSCPVKNG